MISFVSRVAAYTLAVAALAFVAVEGTTLFQAAQASEDSALPSQRIAPLAAQGEVAEVPVLAVTWHPIFGEPQPPGPPPAPEKEVAVLEPQPPMPPAPPLESLGYAYTGIVKAGDSVWGFVSHPTGQRLVRVGDDLVDGAKIVAIRDDALMIDRGRGEAEPLAFIE